MSVADKASTAQVEARPLAGVRVVEFATDKHGSTGRYLAELGADVILVEPPLGAPERQDGWPFGGSGLGFTSRNTSKRSVTLDLRTTTGMDAFECLLSTAEILIEGASASAVNRMWFDVGQIRSKYPSLVVMSISALGRDAAFSDWQVTEPVLLALSGMLSRSGLPGRAPLLPPGELGYECAAMQASFVVLAAYLNRVATGFGDHLDFATVEATAQVLDPGFGIAGSAANGVPQSELPRGRPEGRHLYPIFRCADGYVRICVLSARQWQGMFEWMGRPEAFSDPKFAKIHHRFAAAGVLYPKIGELFASRLREDLVEQGQQYGVPTAAVFDLSETLRAEQFEARRVFTRHTIPEGGSALFPDGGVEIDGQRAQAVRGAPSVGEHTDEVLNALGQPRHPASVSQSHGAMQTRRAPLAGLRVLDLGVIVVGAELGRLLADQGAEVIKIENSAFPDGGRQSLDGKPISASFAYGHRNKTSIGLNLKSEVGKTLFLELASKSDIILSNFKPGTLDSLGLGYEQIKAVNPRIIMADSSAFGPTGPWSRRLGYGPLVRASAGLTSLWRYEDDEQGFSDAVTVYPDHVAARVGATAILALLIRREASGVGGTVSVAQAETILSQIAPALALESIEPGLGRRWDADHRAQSPWGVYPCKGDDDWSVITVRSDDEWQALCHALDRPEAARDPRFATGEARVTHRADVDELVTAWTLGKTPRDVMMRLQERGVPAASMLRVSEMPEFDFFKRRNTYVAFHQAHIDESLLTENAPVISEGLRAPPANSAPLQGEQTIEIAGRLLGMSPDEIDAAISSGVLEVPHGSAAQQPQSATKKASRDGI